MSLLHFPTHPLLADSVAFLWLSEHYEQPHAEERVLPTGTPGLIIGLGRGNDPAQVTGARARSFVLDTSKVLRVIGVCFKPGGGYPFFGPALGELRDASVSLPLLWGQQGHDLREELLEARSPSRRFRVLERHLLARARRSHARHPAVARALEAFGHPGSVRPVGDVARETGLSSRKFIETFRREVGLPPKVFCRVARFGQVLETLDARAEANWTEVALHCGYYDQAHFNHDFREFAGVTPSSYLAGRTSRTHVRFVE